MRSSQPKRKTLGGLRSQLQIEIILLKTTSSKKRIRCGVMNSSRPMKLSRDSKEGSMLLILIDHLFNYHSSCCFDAINDYDFDDPGFRNKHFSYNLRQSMQSQI
mmetsp:Transcript_21001/g.24219  ORF Transcript_21001/g.24219 Transcript_21001/m.24219 type:complete len:104 (+) Transcript_21001:314-625(+)